LIVLQLGALFFTLDKENYIKTIDRSNVVYYNGNKAEEPYYLRSTCSKIPLTEKITYEN